MTSRYQSMVVFASIVFHKHIIIYMEGLIIGFAHAFGIDVITVGTDLIINYYVHILLTTMFTFLPIAFGWLLEEDTLKLNFIVTIMAPLTTIVTYRYTPV